MYKFVPEHIKYFPLSSKFFLRIIPTRTHQLCFPVLQVHFNVQICTGFHQVFALSSKCFSMHNLHQNTSSVFPCPPSLFCCTNSYWDTSSICPVLQVVFLCTIPTRTDQILFPVLQVDFSMYNSYQNMSSIFPCPPSIFSCPPSIFLHTIPTRTHQVFFPFFPVLQNDLVPIIFKIIIEYLLR